MYVQKERGYLSTVVDQTYDVSELIVIPCSLSWTLNVRAESYPLSIFCLDLCFFLKMITFQIYIHFHGFTIV